MGGGEKALSDLWLRAEAVYGEWCWVLGSGVGGSPCAFQPSFALLAWPGSWGCGSWGCRALWGGAEPP